MSLPVKLDDVVEALAEAGEELSHYLDRRTGEIVLLTSEDLEAAEEDELISEYPDWQRESILKAREILNSNDFVELPDHFDIDDYNIMERFCTSMDDRRIGDELLRTIKGSGAFRRFKDAIHSLGIEDAWYAFRRQELERIAVEWLEDEGIAFTVSDEIEPTSDSPM